MSQRIHQKPCLALVSLIVASGCVSAYQPPRANEPHAILKVRRTYEKTAGVALNETVMIGEDRAFANAVGSVVAAVPLTDSLLIHPRPAPISVQSAFSHQELRLVQEQYYEQQPYSTTESYNCGSGTSYRTCSRPTTSYRSVTKTRWVNKWVTVSDGSCSRELLLAPQNGMSYLLQYTYQDNELCSLSCFVQQVNGDGSLSFLPCPR